ncbi:MAG: hypothetical protein K2Q18_09400, partial [Bdellovibrionales bacterium]|nr:hypothetical protein [Bdellovibrionales bacterium]
LYEGYLKTFFLETRWLTSGVLTDIPDSDHIALPSADCKILQIANQSTPILNSDKRYLIDKNLFDNLDNDQKAALLLHEVIYREGIQIGHKNSISSRFLNSLIMSVDIDSLSIQDFSEILQKLGFEENMIQGVSIDLSQYEFYENGHLKFAKVASNALLSFGESLLPIKDMIYFYEDGTIQEFTPAMNVSFSYLKKKFQVFPFPVNFYSNKNLKSLMLFEKTLFTFNGHNLGIKGSVKFHENGLLKSGIVESGTIMTNILNPSIISVNEAIFFYENGNVKEANATSSFNIPYVKSNKIWTGNLKFSPEGLLTSSYMNAPLAVKIQEKNFDLIPYQSIGFWETSGKIRSLQMPVSASLLSQKNKWVRVEAYTDIQLDQNERLIEKL